MILPIYKGRTVYIMASGRNGTFYVGMTNTFPPFDNVKVRQALGLAINNDEMLSTFLT
jgi:ABC-type transport system substrate-binding protein